MNHWNELHNLAARGELVQSNSTERRVHQRACLPPDRPAYERGLPKHDAKFKLQYVCACAPIGEGACLMTEDAVVAVSHVIRTGHTVHVTGVIKAVPVTVLEIDEHDA